MAGWQITLIALSAAPLAAAATLVLDRTWPPAAPPPRPEPETHEGDEPAYMSLTAVGTGAGAAGRDDPAGWPLDG
jgi:hypothetical protein